MELVKHVGDEEAGMMIFASGEVVAYWDMAETVIATPVAGAAAPHVRWLDYDDEADPWNEIVFDPSTPPTRPMTPGERLEFDRIVKLAETAG